MKQNADIFLNEENLTGMRGVLRCFVSEKISGNESSEKITGGASALQNMCSASVRIAC